MPESLQSVCQHSGCSTESLRSKPDRTWFASRFTPALRATNERLEAYATGRKHVSYLNCEEPFLEEHGKARFSSLQHAWTPCLCWLQLHCYIDQREMCWLLNPSRPGLRQHLLDTNSLLQVEDATKINTAKMPDVLHPSAEGWEDMITQCITPALAGIVKVV